MAATTTNIHQQVKEKHVKISAEMERVRRIRAHLLKEFHRKKCTFNEDKDRYEVPSGISEEIVYDQLFFIGKEELNSWCDAYPFLFKSTLENAMLAEGRYQSGKIIWPRDDNYTEVYYNFTEDNSLFEKRRPLLEFDQNEWMLDDGHELTQKDKEVLTKYMHLFSCLLRCLTNAMFLKDKEGARLFYDEDGDGMNGTGFFLCEKERMRIVECLSKAQQVLIQ